MVTASGNLCDTETNRNDHVRRPNDAANPENNVELSVDQKQRLIRLWKAHTRVLIDVKSSAENVNNSAGAPPPFPIDAYHFMARLHAFLVAFLEINATSYIDGNSEGHNNEARSLGPQNSQLYVKSMSNSCMRSYALYAFLKIKDIERNNQMQVRLLEGRHVLTLHHEEFLNEFNHYQVQGQALTDEFIKKHSFGSFLYFKPEIALTAMGCSMALAIVTLYEKQQQSLQRNSVPTTSTLINRYCDTTQLIVRFIHVYPQIQMMDIKTGLVGKFVSLKGHIVKARPKRLRVATADFRCNNCNNIISHSFENGQFSFPSKCITIPAALTALNSNQNIPRTANASCRSRSFTVVRPTARYINVQEIRVQESQEENTMQAGRTPRQIDIELTNDLVNVCRPGDIVLISAIVSAVNAAVANGAKGRKSVQESSTYKLYLIGNSITTMSESNNSNRTSNNGRKSASLSTSRFIYTQQQLRSIVQLCHADHKYFSLVERRAFPFDLLVRSLCPSIIGHNEVKAGLILCLLGGTPTNGSLSSASVVDKGSTIRSNSHILIVGDPGMGKSQMLLAATQLSARSVFVGGNTSSTTGLTVSLTKEEKGEAGIEAGALVLADQGICAIDEFDKMAKNHQDGLLEAMEQQQVSIAKAGIVASLPARCSIIAAANPKHGSYDMCKTVAENLNTAKPILSRFDLVFILRDRANKEQDRMVSSNIMNLYRTKSQSADTSQNNSSKDSTTSNIPYKETSFVDSSVKMPISERLAWVTDFQKQPLPASLVRDYIAYAREYCKPQMTQEAASVLREYYMELRYPSDGKRKRDTVPITTRQLEAMIRLCQARAKAALREYVLKEDALDVVELMNISVDDVHRDEGGYVDRNRGGAGGTSNRKMKKAFTNELHRIIGIGADCTLDDLRRVADKVGCGLNEFQSTLEDFREKGILIFKSTGKYQVL